MNDKLADDIIDRFRAMMDELNLSPSMFADQIGVQRSSISHILSGRNKPSIEFLEKILTAFPGVDINWIISGKQNSGNRVISDTSGKEGLFSGKTVIEMDKGQKIKTPAPLETEPVDHVIIVYKNNTFRILKPA